MTTTTEQTNPPNDPLVSGTGTVDDPWFDVEVELVGSDSNAGAIIGRVARALTRHGCTTETVAAFRAEAMSGDYDNVLRTCMVWVDVS